MCSKCLRSSYVILVPVVVAAAVGIAVAAEGQDSPASPYEVHPLHYINTAFENASPLFYEIAPNGNVVISLVYDQERRSPNRANGHWHFRVEGEPGADITLILQNFDNVWNGKVGSPVSSGRTACYVSADGKEWSWIPTELLEGNRLKIDIHMDGPSLYVARLEPYTLSHLGRLLESLEGKPNVGVETIGRTVQGRALEIIRVGRVDAPRRVFVRARAHAWEPGGNWVAEGMIERLLGPEGGEYLDEFCLYVMPMANKDGVELGHTRFNMAGMDLNRKWDKPADPQLCPENHALEQWLERMIARGRKPDLAIDFHNDAGGLVHIARPDVDLDAYLAAMAEIERLLREHTWFTEGTTKASFRNPGSIGAGLLERYGIVAFVYELNADHIAGLNQPPSARNWKLLGRQLCDVFAEYFETQ